MTGHLATRWIPIEFEFPHRNNNVGGYIFSLHPTTSIIEMVRANDLYLELKSKLSDILTSYGDYFTALCSSGPTAGRLLRSFLTWECSTKAVGLLPSVPGQETVRDLGIDRF